MNSYNGVKNEKRLQEIETELRRLDDEDSAHMADKFGDPEYDNMLPYQRTPETLKILTDKIKKLEEEKKLLENPISYGLITGDIKEAGNC